MASSRMSRAKRSDVDMTQGSIMGHIIRFALPLMLGNLFQQLYNTVDTWVVGNYVSNEAFSAVGTVGPIINMLIGFFTGLATGSGVVISQYYGAKRYDKVRSTVHTAILMTLVLGVLFTAIGILMTPAMLRLMKTPETVFPESSAYLTIYFAGILGLMVYNMGAGILRAVGDSKRPFYFLIVSALLNTVLDLLFVLVFHMGVKGVALATVVAQAISAALVLYVLARTDSCIKLSPQYLKPDFAILGKIIKVGFPAALQMAVTAFSNIFVQSYINHFGADCMAGWTAYAKIDQFILLPAQSIALASTTFVGQNLGINDIARAKKGVGTAVRIGVVTTLLLMLPVIAFAPGLVAFFNSKAEVIEYGSMFLRRISPFYVLVCFNHIYAGALRGAGNSKVPTIIMLCSFVAFRQCYLFIMANFIANEILPIAMAYPAGWFLCSLLTVTYFYRTNLSGTRLVEDEPPQEEAQTTQEA